MKIRNGFVSNSSSSSFIINVDDNFKTVKDVAEYIIKTFRAYDGDNDLFSEEFNNLMKVTDPDSPMFIDSGDETYIRKHDNKFVIVSTQNVSFDKFNRLRLEDLSEEFIKFFEYEDPDDYWYEEDDDKMKHITHMEDFNYYYNQFNDFLILKYNIKGRHTYLNNGCEHCNNTFSKGWELEDGTRICNCEVNKAIRKIKIKKINNTK